MLGIQNRWYFLDVSWISEINRKRGFPLLKRDCEWVAIGSPKILRTIHIPSCSVGISHFVCLNPHLVAFYYSNWSIDPSSHQNMCMEPTRNCSSEKICPFNPPFSRIIPEEPQIYECLWLKIGYYYSIPPKIIFQKGKTMIDQWMEWATLPFDNPNFPPLSPSAPGKHPPDASWATPGGSLHWHRSCPTNHGSFTLW